MADRGHSPDQHAGRVIVLDPDRVALRGVTIASRPPIWEAVKHPGDVLAYFVDFSRVASRDRSIIQFDCRERGGCISILRAWSEANVIGLLLSGGRAHTRIEISLDAVFSDGTAISRDVILRIAGSDVARPPRDVLTINGSPLLVGGVTIQIPRTVLTVDDDPLRVGGRAIDIGG